MRETIHVASATQNANHALSGNSPRTLKTGFDRLPCRWSAITSTPGKMNAIPTQSSSRFRSARAEAAGGFEFAAPPNPEPAGTVSPVCAERSSPPRSEPFSSGTWVPPSNAQIVPAASAARQRNRSCVAAPFQGLVQSLMFCPARQCRSISRIVRSRPAS